MNPSPLLHTGIRFVRELHRLAAPRHLTDIGYQLHDFDLMPMEI
jgi:hypothetical protein